MGSFRKFFQDFFAFSALLLLLKWRNPLIRKGLGDSEKHLVKVLTGFMNLAILIKRLRETR
jgi:hypothetical protein